MISLIGMPGSGKTTVGRQLARRLGAVFLDSDRTIEDRIGCSIRDYFQREGEDAFRAIEEVVLDELTRGAQNTVLSTGGGAVVRAATRLRLRERGIVVYLRASVDELFRRTCRDRNRPLLATADPRGTLRDLMTLREPLYKEVADLVVETGSMPIHTLVKALLPQLQAFEKQI